MQRLAWATRGLLCGVSGVFGVGGVGCAACFGGPKSVLGVGGGGRLVTKSREPDCIGVLLVPLVTAHVCAGVPVCRCARRGMGWGGRLLCGV